MTTRTGATPERLERAREAARLRAGGLKLREIGARIGASPQMVSDLLLDPDGSRARARKDGYRGACRSCGARTSGSNGPAKAPDLCHPRRVWTREKAVAAIQAWAAEHGRPPGASEWQQKIDPPGSRPSSRMVQILFGTWNAGIAAAGFEPTPNGGYRRDGAAGLRPSSFDTLDVVRAHGPMTTIALAAALNVSYQAAHSRIGVLRRRGLVARRRLPRTGRGGSGQYEWWAA